MPWFLTSIGYKYLNLIFLDTFSDLLPLVSSSQKFVSIFPDILMDRVYHGEFFEKIISSTMESDK
ncbi:unnamed protein product [Withania somnifera]